MFQCFLMFFNAFQSFLSMFPMVFINTERKNLRTEKHEEKIYRWKISNKFTIIFLVLRAKMYNCPLPYQLYSQILFENLVLWKPGLKQLFIWQGVRKSLDLCSKGSHKLVNEKNKQEYIYRLARFIFHYFHYIVRREIVFQIRDLKG